VLVDLHAPEQRAALVNGENGAGQVVEVGFTVLASIALPVRLGIIPAMTGHRSMDVVTGYFRAGAAQVSAVARMMDSGKPIPDAV